MSICVMHIFIGSDVGFIAVSGIYIFSIYLRLDSAVGDWNLISCIICGIFRKILPGSLFCAVVYCFSS